jgi:hypothetical protein
MTIPLSRRQMFYIMFNIYILELFKALVRRRRRRPMLTFALRSNVDKLLGPGWWNFTYEFVVDSYKHCKNVEVVQSEIVGHGDLYLCAVFLSVHDKLTCEASSTWTTTNSHVKFHLLGPGWWNFTCEFVVDSYKHCTQM